MFTISNIHSPRSYLMVNQTMAKRRITYLNKCDKFTNFIYSKKILLSDREFLSYKKFLWKPNTIEQSEHIIEILLGYFICDYKSKTLVICDHITSKIFRYKAKHILNHSCDINSCLEVVSKHELRSRMNEYHQQKWDRVVTFGTGQYMPPPPADNYVFVTNKQKIEYSSLV